VRDEQIDFLLAVGGGSVMDGTKFVALAANHGDNCEDLLQHGFKPVPVAGAVPLGTVVTLPATGSEMNSGGVISHAGGKYVFANPLVFPKFSILDPTLTFTLPRTQVANGFVAWLQSLDDTQLHLSAVTLGEIQAGIELTREQDPAKAQEIENWLELVANTYNVLPMDAGTFRAWARLMHRKSDTLYEDAMIAATAQVHGLTVATRNVNDFNALGLDVFNPFTPT